MTATRFADRIQHQPRSWSSVLVAFFLNQSAITFHCDLRRPAGTHRGRRRGSPATAIGSPHSSLHRGTICMRTWNRERGFTLIELLVVIAIIAVLIALL